ncbi:hypothetical protein B0H14DRAFT_2617752 [Mycena olivaceomarginata]|nr:hypothetical protein B0H14DRAFT_2617752 [Mycena olivaceomarginata]
MKFTTILSVLTVVAAVGAARVNTNAARFARGSTPHRTSEARLFSGRCTARKPLWHATSPCKPLLQTCSAHSDCCSDLCILNTFARCFAISLSSSARNSGIGDTGKVTGGIIGSI